MTLRDEAAAGDLFEGPAAAARGRVGAAAGAPERVVFEVPGSPVGKGRPKFVRATGRTYTPEQTVAAETRVFAAARDAMAGRGPFQGPVDVSVTAVQAIPTSWSRAKQQRHVGAFAPTKPDLDNVVKLILDGMLPRRQHGMLWGGVIVDDKQVTRLAAVALYGFAPRVIVTVIGLGDRP